MFKVVDKAGLDRVDCNFEISAIKEKFQILLQDNEWYLEDKISPMEDSRV